MVPVAYQWAGADVGGFRAVSPELSVVICTRDRPVLLRRALDAIRAQTFPGVIETVVVFDRSEPDTSLAVADGTRPVVVIANDHTPGLPGGRNAGVAVARAPVVAFCDDDDVWFPEKAARQHALLSARPEVDVVVCGVQIEVDGRTLDRALDQVEVTFTDLLESRLMEVNFCTAMVRRDAFLGEIGPADEHIPGGYAEDYEWVLRASRSKPIAVVPEPMVIVEWHAQSFFASRWQVIADALAYLVNEYPEFKSSPRGLARILGQRSFALAALGQRKDAWQEIKATLRESWREPRAYLAGIVNTGLVPPDPVVKTLQRMGRGI
jgi:glycosyltransferase involved in cell wall biosynthesis